MVSLRRRRRPPRGRSFGSPGSWRRPAGRCRRWRPTYIAPRSRSAGAGRCGRTGGRGSGSGCGFWRRNPRRRSRDGRTRSGPHPRCRTPSGSRPRWTRWGCGCAGCGRRRGSGRNATRGRWRPGGRSAFRGRRGRSWKTTAGRSGAGCGGTGRAGRGGGPCGPCASEAGGGDGVCFPADTFEARLRGLRRFARRARRSAASVPPSR